jgi:glucose-6-phosphate-specific signal transduction histidine kinase
MSIRSLLSKMPVIYYRIDQDEMIQEMVGGALSKLDLDVENQVAIRATDVFPDLMGKYDMIIQHGRYFFESLHSVTQGEAWFFHYIFHVPENNELTGFALDVTSMKRAQRAMLKLSVDKRNLARRMLQIQEDVRHEVARELHDEIGQSLTAVRVIASAMLGAQDVTPDFYRQSAESISDVADKMYESAHELMYRLHPVVLDTLGLESAIQSCIHSSGLPHAGVDINLEIAGEVEAMDQLVQLTVYRIVQESLTNIAKYAKASAVQIKMERKRTFNESIGSSDLLELNISDDGIGFSDDQQQNKHGMGILGLRERVQALGGVLNISSHAGTGVSLFVRINLKMAEVDS